MADLLLAQSRGGKRRRRSHRRNPLDNPIDNPIEFVEVGRRRRRRRSNPRGLLKTIGGVDLQRFALLGLASLASLTINSVVGKRVADAVSGTQPLGMSRDLLRVAGYGLTALGVGWGAEQIGVTPAMHAAVLYSGAAVAGSGALHALASDLATQWSVPKLAAPVGVGVLPRAVGVGPLPMLSTVEPKRSEFTPGFRL